MNNKKNKLIFHVKINHYAEENLVKDGRIM
jgi:hypothetical protein